MAVRPLGGPFYNPGCPKWPFFGSKMLFFSQKLLFQRHHPKKLLSLWRDTTKTTYLCWLIAWRTSGGLAGSIFGPELTPKTVFFTLHPLALIFGAQTDQTLWDHNFSISWGNSEYFQFSCRCQFTCLAGRFMAPIAQSGSFGGQKCCYLAQNPLCGDHIQKCCYHHDGT